MNEMIAFCGLDCHECGALAATREDDDAKRIEVADQWSRQFGANLQPQDINCDGCVSEGGLLFSHCHVCEIRICGKGRRVENCAYCGDYACDKLGEFLAKVLEAKMRLDEIRNRM